MRYFQQNTPLIAYERLMTETPRSRVAPYRPWRNEPHRLRMLRLRDSGLLPAGAGPQYIAALFLLAADTDLWGQSRGHVMPGRIDFCSIPGGGLGTTAYSLFEAARAIYYAYGIDERRLCDRHTVSDELFDLIMDAKAISRYGMRWLEQEAGCL